MLFFAGWPQTPCAWNCYPTIVIKDLQRLLESFKCLPTINVQEVHNVEKLKWMWKIKLNENASGMEISDNF